MTPRPLRQRLLLACCLVLGLASQASAGWTYETQPPDALGRAMRIARTTSREAVELAWPFAGRWHVELRIAEITRGDKSSTIVGFAIPKGQFVSRQSVACRVDDGQVWSISAHTPDSGSLNLLFLDESGVLMVRLLAGKRLTVEVVFYGDGPRLLTFDLADLDWPDPITGRRP
jgi:hypothetical protein